MPSKLGKGPLRSGISRRTFVKQASLASAATTLGYGLAPTVSAQSNSFVICTFGGQTFDAHRKAYFEPFEKETGLKIIDASPTNFGKLKAMVQSGNPEWDLVDAGDRHMHAAIKENLLEPLDYKSIDNSGFLPNTFNPFGLGAFYWSINLCSSGKRERVPTTWVEFHDVKSFPGNRALRNSSFDNMEFALLADGVPITDIYPLTKDKIARAYKKLEQLKPHVLKWWNVEAQVVQMLTDGEVAYADGPAGRLAVIQRQGAKVNYVWNQGIVHGDSWIIPKGAKNKEHATRFLAWYASHPERQAEFAKHIPYGPLHTKALDYLDKEYAATLCTAPQNLKQQLVSNGEWWGQEYETMEREWKNWILR